MSRKNPQKKSKRNNTNTLRIIGGEWRSRKLSFIDAQGLRPTPDRIRETLFNWLQAYIHGANCLDLFAGSGILGLEALSRAAARVDFVEMNSLVAKQLEVNLNVLNASTSASVYQGNALSYLEEHKTLENRAGVYNIIFLDPPYRQNLLPDSLKILCAKKNGFVNDNTLIYLEHESEESYDWDEYGLKVLKQANAGQVKSYLLGFNGSNGEK